MRCLYRLLLLPKTLDSPTVWQLMRIFRLWYEAVYNPYQSYASKESNSRIDCRPAISIERRHDGLSRAKELHKGDIDHHSR